MPKSPEKLLTRATRRRTGDPPHQAFMSIGGLSRATGVPIETLRTWEHRYGFPKSVRKPSGHRQFEVADVERVRRISAALDRGLRAGEVVPASEAVLDSLLATVPLKPVTRTAAQPVDERALVELVRKFDADRLMRSLHSDLSHEDPLVYIETRIAPCLEMIGAAWEKGEIDIAHEHFASERISDVLRGARLRFEETANGPLVALATLPGEGHGLGLQMAALVLSARGLRILNLGTEVPVVEVAALAAQVNASAVGLSVSAATARNAAVPISALRSRLDRNIELLVGGAGAPGGVKGTVPVGKLRDLDAWAEGRMKNRRNA